jgi:hypothetical protein
MRQIIFSALLLCVAGWSQADERPYIAHLADTYAIIFLPDEAGVLVAQSDQTLLANHVLMHGNMLSPAIDVLVRKDEVEYQHTIHIYPEISDPVVRVQLIDKQQIEYGYEYTAQLETNVAQSLLSDVYVVADGQTLAVKPFTPFSVKSFANELRIKSVININRYKQVEHEQVWTHNLPHQVDCDFLYTPPTLDAMCFSNRDAIVEVDFLLDDFTLGRHGSVVIGDAIPDELVLRIQMASEVLYYALRYQDGAVVKTPIR